VKASQRPPFAAGHKVCVSGMPHVQAFLGTTEGHISMLAARFAVIRDDTWSVWGERSDH
jgi:hypothetical protein